MVVIQPYKVDDKDGQTSSCSVDASECVRASRGVFPGQRSFDLSRGLGSKSQGFNVLERQRVCDTQRKAERARSKGEGADLPHSVFVDVDAMKDKVRKALAKPKRNVRDLYKEDGVFQAIAKNHYFESLTLCVISFNALWIAIDTDINKEPMLMNAHPVFQVAENAFCFFFFFEWVVRFMAFRRKRDSLKDGWFMFDSLLVFTMVLETWVMTSVALASSSGSDGPGGNASVLKVARLLRLSRMARMARLLRAMPELMILIKGMLAASRSVLFTLLLLLTLMYVFAIAMTQLLEDTKSGERFFSNVPHSMYTLWIYGTLLDEIGLLARRMAKDSHVCVVLFFLFVLFAALTVMNMLIGVLCEVVSAVAATEKEEMMVGYVHDKLRNVLKILDQDGNMRISKHEFMQILENVEAARCLQDVGVDVVGLIDFADAIFQDDSNSENGCELDFPKFMDIVLQLRGTNTATVKDMVDLRKFLRDAIGQTQSQILELASQMEEVLAGAPAWHSGSRDLRSSGTSHKSMDAHKRGADCSNILASLLPVSGHIQPEDHMLPVTIDEVATVGEGRRKLSWQDPPMALKGPWLPCEQQGSRRSSSHSPTRNPSRSPSPVAVSIVDDWLKAEVGGSVPAERQAVSSGFQEASRKEAELWLLRKELNEPLVKMSELLAGALTKLHRVQHDILHTRNLEALYCPAVGHKDSRVSTDVGNSSVDGGCSTEKLTNKTHPDSARGSGRKTSVDPPTPRRETTRKSTVCDIPKLPSATAWLQR